MQMYIYAEAGLRDVLKFRGSCKDSNAVPSLPTNRLSLVNIARATAAVPLL